MGYSSKKKLTRTYRTYVLVEGGRQYAVIVVNRQMLWNTEKSRAKYGLSVMSEV